MSVVTPRGRAELAAILGVTERQIRYVLGDGKMGVPERYTPEQVRRLQVAASLAHTLPEMKTGTSMFPSFARAVLDCEDDPEPGCWAVYTDGEVRYVHYSADVAGAVKRGGVVVPIDKLWPDTIDIDGEAPAT